MKNKLLLLLMAALLTLALGGVTSEAQVIRIVKYGLSPGATGFSPSQTTNTGLYINNLPMLDSNGQTVQPMAGVHYRVTGGGATYELTTDQTGQAATGNLPGGTYTVTEEAAPTLGLTSPAKPVRLQLPQAGVADNTVYLYPKSSLDKAENASTGPSTGPSSHSPAPVEDATERSAAPSGGLIAALLPHTGDASSWLPSLAGLGFIVLILALRHRQRKDEEKSRE